jgi:YD repeat-containing protein
LSASYNNYVYASSPSGFVYPGSVESISFASPAASFTTSNVSGNSIVKDSRYKLESSALFSNGNIVEITPKNGVKTSYLWGYKNTLPIAKAVGTDFSTLSSAFASAGYNLTQLRNQASVSGSLVNVYSYHPFFGMTSETDANGKTLTYSYDRLQRLIIVRDQNNNIVRRICYGYAGQPGDCNLFYNTELSVPFTRNNCGAGFTGTTVNYIVPAGTYASTISVADANAMAQNDANTNGQAYANINGTCVGASITVQGYNSKSFNYKVRFTNNSTGTFYVFDLTAGTFNYSTLGQIPAGTYMVDFYATLKPTTATFVVNGFVLSGSSATFYNISVSSLTNAYMY